MAISRLGDVYLLDQYYLVEKRRHLRQELQLNAEGLPRPSQSSEPACGVWEFVFHKELSFSQLYQSRLQLLSLGKGNF